jgi:hypothetical protein
MGEGNGNSQKKSRHIGISRIGQPTKSRKGNALLIGSREVTNPEAVVQLIVKN